MAKFFSFDLRASSACLRFSISVFVPNHFSRLFKQRTAAEEKPAKLAVTPPKPACDLEPLPGSQSRLEYFQNIHRLFRREAGYSPARADLRTRWRRPNEPMPV